MVGVVSASSVIWADASAAAASRAAAAAAGAQRNEAAHLHLHHGVYDEDAVAELRERLVAMLASDVRHVVVHAGQRPDVDLVVLRALHAVGQHLTGYGGALLLVGAHPRVVTQIRIYGLVGLLPDAGAAESGAAVLPAAPRRVAAQHAGRAQRVASAPCAGPPSVRSPNARRTPPAPAVG